MNQIQTDGQTPLAPKEETVTDATIVTETTTSTAAAPVKKSYIKYVLLGILVSVVLGGLYTLYTQPKDTAAAIVNGIHITTAELEENVAMMSKSAEAQGVNVSDITIQSEIRAQALENLISNALLIGAAQDAGLGSNEAAVQSAYENLVSEVGGEEELKTRMETVGLTSETLFKNIGDRIMVDAYIESVTDIEAIQVTDEEIDAYISSITTEGVTLPPLEEIRPQIETTILAEKQQRVVTELIEELRADAEVEIPEAE